MFDVAPVRVEVFGNVKRYCFFALEVTFTVTYPLESLTFFTVFQVFPDFTCRVALEGL